MTRRAAPLCAGLALLGCCGAALACEHLESGAGLSLAHSRWDESDEQGRRLLRESGPLAGAWLSLGADCAGWQARATLGTRSGTRDYRGQSSSGAAIRTDSGIREQRLQFSVQRALALPHWSWGLRAEWQALDRDLASVGAVQGYPERHRRATLALGLATQHEAFAGWHWVGALWLGGGPRGTVDVRFPHAEPVRLDSGVATFGEASLALRLNRAGAAPARQIGWQGELKLSLRDERIAAGPAAPLWRNGVLVGAARQPRHRVIDAGLQATAVWHYR